MVDLLQLVEKYQLCPHLYADDTQIYGSCHPSAASQLPDRVSTRWHCGCGVTGSSWMPVRPRSYGVRPADVSIRSHRRWSEYALTLFSLHPRSVILESTLTPPWGRTFPGPCPTVLLSSARYGAFADHWRGRFCSRSSYHLCLGLTTAMRRLPDCRTINLVGCSPCWTLLLDWCSQPESTSPSSAAPWPALAASAATNWFQAGGAHVPLSPPYLADELCRVADVDSRRRLRSASTSTFIVPPMRHSTIGDRAFPAAASRVCNSLPSSVTSSTPLTVFRRRIKTELFLRCFGSDCAWRFSCRYSVSCLTPNASFLL